jgi:hypothetical protein
VLILQNFTSESGRIRYFVFDLLCYENRDLTPLPLIRRRDMLRSLIKFDDARVKIAEYVEASAEQMVGAVREQRWRAIFIVFWLLKCGTWPVVRDFDAAYQTGGER